MGRRTVYERVAEFTFGNGLELQTEEQDRDGGMARARSIANRRGGDNRRS